MLLRSITHKERQYNGSCRDSVHQGRQEQNPFVRPSLFNKPPFDCSKALVVVPPLPSPPPPAGSLPQYVSLPSASREQGLLLARGTRDGWPPWTSSASFRAVSLCLGSLRLLGRVSIHLISFASEAALDCGWMVPKGRPLGGWAPRRGPAGGRGMPRTGIREDGLRNSPSQVLRTWAGGVIYDIVIWLRWGTAATVERDS